MVNYSDPLKMKPKGANPYRKVVVWAVLVTLLVSGLILFLVSDRPKMKVVPPEQAAEAEAETKPTADVPTVEQAIDAAIRAHSRATKVCYDEKIEGFLIHYPYMKPDENGTRYFDGWYYLKWHQMWQTENGVWFMKEFDSNEYVKVHPDTTGLTCKNT